MLLCHFLIILDSNPQNRCGGELAVGRSIVLLDTRLLILFDINDTFAFEDIYSTIIYKYPVANCLLITPHLPPST